MSEYEEIKALSKETGVRACRCRRCQREEEVLD
jgi:hypothetical protein